jgi:transmembrane sensor
MSSRTEQIQDQAAAWADALHQSGDDPAVRRDFERWRDSDPEHAEIYDRIDRGYRITRGIEGSGAHAGLRQETLARVAGYRRRRRQRTAAAVAASVIAVIAVAFTLSDDTWSELQYQQARAGHAVMGETLYRTAIGERRIVNLEDGSTLTLNTDSRAVVRYRDHTRNVALLQGQGLFEVAHDPARPFVVQAGERKVTALGTAFDIRLSQDGVAVTLIQGRVAVENTAPLSGLMPDSAARARKATNQFPGDQLIATAADADAPVIHKTDLRRATSWREGRLLFENENLAQAVAEVNRYGGRRIVLDDPTLGTLRISGAFKTGNPDAFLDTLSWHLPIRIVGSDDEQIIVGRKG